MSVVPIITTLLLGSVVPIQRRCTWFRRGLVQDGFIPSVTAKKDHFVLTAMLHAGKKTVELILGLANRSFALRSLSWSQWVKEFCSSNRLLVLDIMDRNRVTPATVFFVFVSQKEFVIPNFERSRFHVD